MTINKKKAAEIARDWRRAFFDAILSDAWDATTNNNAPRGFDYYNQTIKTCKGVDYVMTILVICFD